MKQFILIISLLCTLYCHSQRIALLDKNFNQPILFTDSISVEQIKSGYFPIATTHLDTFYANVKYVLDMLKIRQRAKMQSFELRAGGSLIKVTRVPYAYGDRYLGTAYNQFNEIKAIMPLLYNNVSNKDNAKRLQKLLDYLDRNKSLFKDPYEITPKIYNVIVITE